MSPSAHPQADEREREREGSSSSPLRSQRAVEVTEGGGHMQNSNTRSQAPRTEQELAQAFRDLARGEQAATALEVNLTSLESRLDELLASFEDAAGGLPPDTNHGGDQSSSGGKRQADPEPRANGHDTTEDK